MGLSVLGMAEGLVRPPTDLQHRHLPARHSEQSWTGTLSQRKHLLGMRSSDPNFYLERCATIFRDNVIQTERYVHFDFDLIERLKYSRDICSMVVLFTE